MKKETLKLMINRKEIFINKMEWLGDEKIGDTYYEVFSIDNIVFYFTIDEYIEERVTNYGDGDIPYKVRITELDELDFYIDTDICDNPIYHDSRLYLSKELSNKITDIANYIYYNVEEI